MTKNTRQRVAVVTGASSGIGKSTARMLAEQGWHVIGTGRHPERTAAAAAEIRAAASPDAKVNFVRGDFDIMADVLRVAGEIKQLTDRIDVLINNAGGVRDRQIITPEGNEGTFAANHLSAFLLTRELLPLLRSAVADSPPGSVRVIAVSSLAHEYTQGFDWSDFQTIGTYSTNSAYCRAKLANILFTRELARRFASDGIVAQAMHPGRVDSNFASHGDQAMQEYFKTASDVDAPDKPAQTLVWLATAPEAGKDGGRYFYDCEEVPAAPQALDDEAAHRLWDESEKILQQIGI
jgi:NAD(P)-dependent dehydrogenase (short-subunit alcohol dehydrogenase family)